MRRSREALHCLGGHFVIVNRFRGRNVKEDTKKQRGAVLQVASPGLLGLNGCIGGEHSAGREKT